MFIPFDRPLDWKNPPFVTVLIILVNVLVFFGWQHRDEDYADEAFGYYFETSDLPRLELPAYLEHLRAGGASAEADRLAAQLETPAGEAAAFKAMLEDARFVRKLRAGEVIVPGDAAYERWAAQRTRFEALLQRAVSFRHGLVPADPGPASLILHMFLHADLGHLLGNMVFLFLFGYVVEIALGRAAYLGAYLLAGLASAGLDIALNAHSTIVSIGASGAISGVVAMYTVLFGLRKIRFFYWVLFYFDYIKAPAIVLLPLWLGYEALYALLEPSNVNRVAHIGGLLGGAALAFAAKKWLGIVNHAYLAERDQAEDIRQRYERGMRQMAAMEMEQARATFADLLAAEPDYRPAMVQLYNIAKLKPDSEAYHTAAWRIMSLPGRDAATNRLVHDTFCEYARLARPAPRYRPEKMLELAVRFSASGFLDEAERIVATLLRKRADLRGLPESLLALAKGYAGGGQAERYRQCLRLLVKHYPDSAQAHQIRQSGLLHEQA